jgi:hypothetical protein
MTETTQDDLIKKSEMQLAVLHKLYVPGDSYATHLKVAEMISWYLDKLVYLKGKN